jgi:hypothetical protein
MTLLAMAGSQPRNAGPAAPRPHIEMLTLSEIGGSGKFDNVYDMLAELRPGWLHPRATDSDKASDVIVRLDDREYGMVEGLRTLSTVRITSVQFFDSQSAMKRWGAAYAHGAILITTRSMRQ